MITEFKTYEKWPVSSNITRFGEGGKRLKSQINQYDKNNPLISIITVTYNGEKYIEETFQSVFKQTNKNYEYIVIDGGSSDNTINIIKKYDSKIDYWVSEKDLGIYDAFNKGMQLCKGEYIGFINSDDIYEKNTIEILTKYIKANSNLDFFFGSVRKHWGILHGYKPWKIFFSWGFYSSHSTGFFIKKVSAKKVGLYNLKYKYSSDYDYFFSMATKKKELFGTFRRGGYSSQINFYDHFMEEIKIRLDNKQNRLLVLLIFMYKFLKHIKKL